jgi:hypothetical protein
MCVNGLQTEYVIAAINARKGFDKAHRESQIINPFKRI